MYLFALSECRDGDQFLAETGPDHRGHAALHLHAGGMEVASLPRKHPQGPVDAALVGDEVSPKLESIELVNNQVKACSLGRVQ